MVVSNNDYRYATLAAITKNHKIQIQKRKLAEKETWSSKYYLIKKKQEIKYYQSKQISEQRMIHHLNCASCNQLFGIYGQRSEKLQLYTSKKHQFSVRALHFICESMYTKDIRDFLKMRMNPDYQKDPDICRNLQDVTIFFFF